MTHKRAINHIVLTLLALVCAFFLADASKFNTNILQTFSSSEIEAGFRQAQSQYESFLTKEVTLSITSDSPLHSVQLSKEISSEIAKSGFFELNTERSSSVENAIKEHLRNHLGAIIKDRDPPEEVYQSAIQSYFSPFSSISSLVAIDPLNLSQSFLASVTPSFTLSQQDGVFLSTRKENTAISFLSILETKEEQAFQFLQSLQTKFAHKKVDIRFSSVSFFNIHAKASALREALTLSFISIVLIILLFILSLKSLRILFFSLGHILTTLAVSTCLMMLFFKELHLISILLSISTIGLLADHSIHYFINQFKPEIENPQAAFNEIWSPLRLSLLTTIIGFSVFYLYRLDVFVQFATFSIIALLNSLAVLYLFTRFYFQKGHEKENYNFLPIIVFKQKTRVLVILSITCILSIVALATKNIPDDITRFKQTNLRLSEDEVFIREALGLQQNLSYFIVRASTQESLLQREEAITLELKKKDISFLAISNWIPSNHVQDKSLEYFATLAPFYKKIYQELGHKNADTQAALLLKQQSNEISLEQWQQSYPFHPINNLYLGQIDDNFYSVVQAFNLHAFNDFRCDQCFFIDKVTQVNTTMNMMKKNFIWAGLAVLILAFALISLWHGLNAAFVLTLAPASSTLIAIALAAHFFDGFNLFQLLAGLLVFVLSIDYSFFFYFAGRNWRPNALGVFLSSGTTILSFGVLIFSENAAIASFGAVTSLGIAISYLISPLSLRGANAD